MKKRILLLLCVAWFRAMAQAPPTDVERRIALLEARIAELEKLVAAQPAAAIASVVPAQPAPAVPVLGAVPAPIPVTSAVQRTAPAPPLIPVSVSGDYRTFPSTETRLPVAGYMDFHVNKDSGDPFRPDFHRFVLLFGHSFSDRIKFWSEFELEHALVEGEEKSGEIALEQAYLDFLITPKFNLRAGMVLAPVGIVNERHEPPSFNGVERPFVETLIIPTTWRELGMGVTGDLGRGFRYRGYITSQLDAARFDAESGITEGRTQGFEASLRNPAKVGRFEYAGVRRLTLGTSFYTGHTGFNIPGINPRVDMYEFDGRYSVKRLDLRGLFANTWVSRTGELNRRTQIQTGVNPNVASQMRGYYLEPAVHVFSRRASNDLILFTRYEKYNTQQRMASGYLPLGEFNRSSWVTGITYKPNADVAVKFDYVVNANESRLVRAVNGVNLGIGWWF
ncbi:MAG: hypothetical protein ABI811_08455 [Acidobacteriota bacterium]